MPNVRNVSGRLSVCKMGFNPMFTSESTSANTAMIIHALSPPMTSMPGTIQAAAATATAVASQRAMKFIREPFSLMRLAAQGFLGSIVRHARLRVLTGRFFEAVL